MSDEERREHGRKLVLAHYVGENVQTVDHEQPIALTKAGYTEIARVGKLKGQVVFCAPRGLFFT
jgi:hypothetical protein